MKKIVLFTILMCISSQLVFADNSGRIKELQAQQQRIAQEIQQAQQYIAQRQAEFIKLQGKIEMLQELDQSEVKKEEKKDD